MSLCTGTIASLTTCDYPNFLANINAACNMTEIFAGIDDREAYVNDLCKYDAPTQFIEIQGTYQLDRRYFHGGGPLVDGGNWALDAASITRFAATMSDSTLIAFPNYAAREPYGPNGYPANMNLFTSCGLKTVMCCFTDDGTDEGFDGFDSNGDATTDVCHHDLANSPESNFINKGWSVMPGTETETHCVGFTWDTPEEEALIGNMMYDVSLSNSATKGYTQGIPGAPMCGCIEHMPVVEEASCRTAEGEVTYAFDYTEGVLGASNAATIAYSNCGDLKAAVLANNATSTIGDHLVGDGGCAASTYLNDEQFLAEAPSPRYLFPDTLVWSGLVVGEGTYFQPRDLDYGVADAKFRALLDAGCTDTAGNARTCIVRRICASCAESHRDVYYKRLTALPAAEQLNMLKLFMDEWTNTYNDMAAGDFKLYSTYQDALDDEDAWTFCNYNYNGVGFPRNCGPKGSGDMWNAYAKHHGGYANHHGFYVELP